MNWHISTFKVYEASYCAYFFLAINEVKRLVFRPRGFIFVEELLEFYEIV